MSRQSDNSLVQWNKAKWRTYSGKKSKGKLRYLPAKAWKHLSSKEARATNRAKRKGHSRGKQYVRQPPNIAEKTRQYSNTSGKIAKKSNPRLWKEAKRKACSQAGMCKHSAVKMNWAVRYYKKHGGKYTD